MIEIVGEMLHPGNAEGPLSVWPVGLSFWGGYDSADGRVIDRSHPAFGACLTGTILAIPSGRGSSSSSSVLAEAIRLGTAPAGIVMTRADPIILVGAMVAAKLYGKALPVMVISEAAFAALAHNRIARMEGTRGRLSVRN